MDDIRVSVAMATYNGEKYIREQLDSILKNLEEFDEIVISDDGSNDKTREIIKSYKDNRIKVFDGPRRGVKKNFENAIKMCRGKYIFLSDQDDIWKDDKVEKVLKEFEKNNEITLVVHDAIVFDSENDKILHDSFFRFRNSGKGVVKNIIKNTYIGCCMIFKAEVKEKILDIPDNIEMHDQWIGIVNEKECGKTLFLTEKLIFYRRHLHNVSEMKHYPVKKMILNRYNFIRELLSKNNKE